MLGFALDITVADPDDGMPWDFNIEAKGVTARTILRTQRIPIELDLPTGKGVPGLAPGNACAND